MLLLRVVATILLLLCCAAPAEVTNIFRQQMSDGRYICGSIDIRNSADSLNQLRNCSVVEGFVQIVLIENATYEDFTGISFPELVEITGYLMFYRVHGLTSLGALFPNLAVIRGQPPFYNYAFVIHDMPDLTEIGLWSLSKIMRSSVHIAENWNLCYVDTVNWTSLAPYGSNMIAKNRNNCSQTTCGKTCTNCWGEGWSEKCSKSKQDTARCGKLCLGGCKKNKPDQCNSCAGVFTGTICSEKCPHGRYEFLGRRCLTDTECQEMVDPHLMAPDSNFEEVAIHLDRMWWPHNGSCDHSCLTGSQKSRTAAENLSCETCQGGKCHRKCNGITVSSISSAQLLKGCTYISGSLEIQIQGMRHVVDELQENLNSIEEIEGYLKVSRSFPLLNLDFLQHLQVIHGQTVDQGKYALIVMENNNLEDLWNWSSRSYGLKIRNGSLFFHFNPKLCLSKIDKLRDISGAPNYSNSEVARESNGDKMACEIKKIKSYVKTKASRGVVIEWEPFTDVPKEKLLGYIVYYIEAPQHINLTFYDGRDECNSYGWRAIDVAMADEKPNQLLTQLKPFTQYAFYVETYFVTNKGGRSEVQYFTTLPDRPSLPTKVLSVSNSSSEIILTWEPPIHPNGVLTHYVVTGVWQHDNQKYLDYRDYCTYPLKPESEIGLVPSDGKSENQTNDCCIVIPKKFEISDKVVFEHMCKSKQLLHSKYTEKSHVSNEVDACYNYFHTYMHEGLRLNKTRQEFQMIRVGENEWQGYPPHVSDVNSQHPGFPNSAENYTAVENGAYKNFTYLVDAKENTFILRNLHHFALYTISLYACRKPLYYIDENGKNVSDYNFCSYASIVNTRTLADPTLDEINYKQMAVDSFNHSLSDVYISWKEPKRPNGVIVAYKVEYRMVDIENFDPVIKCETRKKHERNGGGYVVENLSPGNYSFRVRAISLAGDGIFTEMKYYWVGEKPGELLSLTKTLILVFACLVTFLLAAFALYLKTSKLNKSPPPLVASVNPDYVSTNGYKFFDDEWEIQRDSVTLLQELGQGFFGTVYEGTMNPGDVHCAVKTVPESATRRQMMEFLNEASVMKLFSDAHHVVKLLGVVSKVFPPLVIMELMINGDLKSYLRATRDNHTLGQPGLQQILLMAAQIADGMAYLGDNKFVHRDLAARNCMVAEDLTVKIGDFGMTRDIYETDYYRNDTKGLLPVRWMAPESLADGVFTSQSDVWSYGVVLWEMATLAEQPYQGMSNELVLQHVLAGGCLESPILCPDILRQLMESCWHSKPSKRLKFFDIIAKMEEVTELGAVFRERSYYCRREIPNEKFACDTQQDELESVEPSTSRPNVTFYHSNNSGDIVAQWNQHSTAPEAEPLLLPTNQNYVEHEAQQRNSINRIQPNVGDKNYIKKVTNGTAGGCILPFKNYCENKK